MTADLLQLLRDVRALVHDLGLGEYGHRDSKAKETVERIDRAVADLSDSGCAPPS